MRRLALLAILLAACSSSYRRSLLTDQIPAYDSRARVEASLEASGWCITVRGADTVDARWGGDDQSMLLSLHFEGEHLVAALLRARVMYREWTEYPDGTVVGSNGPILRAYHHFEVELQARYGDPVKTARGFSWWQASSVAYVGLGMFGNEIREVYLFDPRALDGRMLLASLENR